jgi:hypothetical protein
MYPCTHDRGTGFAGVQILQPLPQPQQNPSTYPGVKGVPARESRTGARLVSPAEVCKKKKWTPPERRLGTPNSVHKNMLLVSTDNIESGTTSGRSLAPESEWKNICLECIWKYFHIWTIYFSHTGSGGWLRLGDSVGKYTGSIVLWARKFFLIHFICLVSFPMCISWARATELGVRRLWDIRAREAPNDEVIVWLILLYIVVFLISKLVSPADFALKKKSTPGLFFRCRSTLAITVIFF